MTGPTSATRGTRSRVGSVIDRSGVARGKSASSGHGAGGPRRASTIDRASGGGGFAALPRHATSASAISAAPRTYSLAFLRLALASAMRSAQPSLCTCLMRVSASAPRGTSRVIVEPAPT